MNDEQSKKPEETQFHKMQAIGRSISQYFGYRTTASFYEETVATVRDHDKANTCLLAAVVEELRKIKLGLSWNEHHLFNIFKLLRRKIKTPVRRIKAPKPRKSKPKKGVKRTPRRMAVSARTGGLP